MESEAYLFADDTKIFRVINSLDDQQILQNNLVKLENWSDTWLLKFHPENVNIWTYIKHKEDKVKYNLLGQEINKVKDEKDIGVVIDEELELSFDTHICEKANYIFAAIRRTFRNLHVNIFIPLYMKP